MIRPVKERIRELSTMMKGGTSAGWVPSGRRTMMSSSASGRCWVRTTWRCWPNKGCCGWVTVTHPGASRVSGVVYSVLCRGRGNSVAECASMWFSTGTLHEFSENTAAASGNGFSAQGVAPCGVAGPDPSRRDTTVALFTTHAASCIGLAPIEWFASGIRLAGEPGFGCWSTRLRYIDSY